jgi:peroxiredoxin
VHAALRSAPLVASVLVLILGLLALRGTLASRSVAPVGPPLGAPAPDFRLATLDGEPIALSALRGRPVVVYFFATWCPSCQFDLPMLDAVQQDHARRGLVVLLVDVQDAPERVRSVVEGWRYRGPVALDHTGAVARQYQLQTLPTTVFIAGDGTLRDLHRGALTHAALDAALARLLAGSRSSYPSLAWRTALCSSLQGAEKLCRSRAARAGV